MHPFCRFLLLSLLLLSLPLRAAPLLVDGSQETLDAAGHLQVLEDPAGRLDVASADAADGWRELPGRLNAGYSTSAYWLRLHLLAERPLPGGWMLRLGNALLDDVRVYVRRDDGWHLLGHAGEDVSHREWPVDYRSAVIPFELDQAGEQLLLLRVEGRNALQTSVEVWPRLLFDNHSRREGLFFGLHFGFYLLLIGLLAVFWLATRAPLSGLILLYLGLSVLNEVTSLGLIQQITGLRGFWSDKLLGAGFAINLLVAFRVSIRQLRMPVLYPRTSRWLDRFFQGVAVVCLLLVLFGRYAWGVVPVLWLGLGLILLFGSFCARMLWRGYVHARLFALIFGVFYLGVLTAFLRNLGILPLNPWTEHASTLGTMVHMLLLILWLILRYERKRRVRQRWQANLGAALAKEHSLQLSREVAQRTSDLREEIERRELLEQELRDALGLEQRLRAEQREFIAMVSHEFRTPLAIITTLAQRIEQAAPTAGVRNAERCQQIRDAATRLLALVDEYLSDDRMSESRVELRYEPCNLQELLAELSQDYAPGRIRTSFRRAPDGLVTDVGLLHIALRNLLANADRHSLAEESVEVEVDVQGDWLQIDICNRGDSIPEQERDRLFRKYFRGQSARRMPGAGLGLYLVWRISEMLGGDVTLLSAGGEQGVCFRLRVPCDPVHNLKT